MKTKRLIIGIAVIGIFLSAPLFARDRIVDNAGLLNSAEKAELLKMIDKVAETYKFELVIVSEKNIGAKDPKAYADDFFDHNGYGLGSGRDGCLFLQVPKSRDYWFSTSGRGEKILNGSAFSKLEADVVDYLKMDSPSGAYRSFVRNWEEFLSLEAKGRSYNFFYAWNMYLVIGAWIIAFIIGVLIVQSMKAKMNTALPKYEADTYVVPGSLVFTQQSDRFLYSRTSRTKREKQSSSSGGTHTSSSGRSHGGGGGKY